MAKSIEQQYDELLRKYPDIMKYEEAIYDLIKATDWKMPIETAYIVIKKVLRKVSNGQ